MKYTIALKRSYAKANPDIRETFPEFATRDDAQLFIEENGIDADFYSIVKAKNSLMPESLTEKGTKE